MLHPYKGLLLSSRQGCTTDTGTPQTATRTVMPEEATQRSALIHLDILLDVSHQTRHCDWVARTTEFWRLSVARARQGSASGGRPPPGWQGRPHMLESPLCSSSHKVTGPTALGLTVRTSFNLKDSSYQCLQRNSHRGVQPRNLHSRVHRT